MRKRIISMAATAMLATATWAGGLMTNTNYHIAFDRMMARGASFDVDAAFSNPAGLVWGHEGWQLSLNFQKPWQDRDIQLTANNFLAIPAKGYAGVNIDQKFPGKASAPIVPALFASYRKDNWAVSAMIGIVGSGGFVKYSDGIPMFNALVMAKLLTSASLTPNQYNIDSEMKGKQYIYGGQLNYSYKITNNFAAAVGLRANYYDGYNRGYIYASMPGVNREIPLLDLQLDCLQKGWGFTPIISLDYHKGPLTVAARYEFRTKINTENDTKTLSAVIMNSDPATRTEVPYVGGDVALRQFGDKVAAYEDCAKTRYDMPSLLSLAIGYEFTDKLRATIEYHNFDDKHAKMANDRQNELTHGTHEFLAGVEYDINDKFTVSCGGQRTDYGLDDNYQQNTSFACDSWSVGLGGAWNINKKVRLNAGYFITIYSDYQKESAGYQGTPWAATETYSRTNNVIGLGIDYKF